MQVAVAKALSVNGTRAAQAKSVGGQRERNAEALASANRRLHRLAVLGRIAGNVDLGECILLDAALELVAFAEHRRGQTPLFALVIPCEIAKHLTPSAGVADVLSGHPSERPGADDEHLL